MKRNTCDRIKKIRRLSLKDVYDDDLLNLLYCGNSGQALNLGFPRFLILEMTRPGTGMRHCPWGMTVGHLQAPYNYHNYLVGYIISVFSTPISW